MANWTNIAKPPSDSRTTVNTYTGGDPIGFLLALTYSTVTQSSVISSFWTDIPEASGGTYTKISKASITIASWSKIPEASGGTYTNIQKPSAGSYTKVPKAS